MLPSFATVGDLEQRLNRTFGASEKSWIEGLLRDAAAYLRGHIGSHVHPPVQVTVQLWPADGWVDVPGTYIASIDEVSADGQPIEYTIRDNSLWVGTDRPVTVKYTSGLEEAPSDLVGLNCALVSQALFTLEQDLGLTVGGLSSVALDDFRLAWANAGEAAGMFALTATNIAYLDKVYGSGATVTGRR